MGPLNYDLSCCCIVFKSQKYVAQISSLPIKNYSWRFITKYAAYKFYTNYKQICDTRWLLTGCLIFLILSLIDRGGMLEIQKAGSTLPSLAGSSTRKSGHRTHSVDGDGGGRWLQPTVLVHRPSSTWRGRW